MGGVLEGIVMAECLAVYLDGEGLKDILSRGPADPLGSLKSIGRLESGCLNSVAFWSY